MEGGEESMGIGGWLLLVGIGLVVIVALMVKADSNASAAQKALFAAIPDFVPDSIYLGGSKGSAVAVDSGKSKLAILGAGGNVSVVDFSDVLGVEVLRNGTSITKTNRGSQVAGAAVGAVLLGPVGLLLGGVTGSKRQDEKVKRLSIKIFINDLKSPVHEVAFFIGPEMKSDTLVVKTAAGQLDEWEGRLKAILSRNPSA
jgi:hypothetical protein